MTAAPTRCLWLTKGLGRGGVERLLVDMYPLVDRSSFEVDVAYVLPWKDAHHGSLEALGAGVHCLGASNGLDLRWVPRLRRLLRSGGYQIVHTHAPLTSVAARSLTAAAGNGTAIVHTEHNVWDRYRRPTRFLNALTYHRNDAAIAVSDAVASSIEPVRPGRAPTVETVHHGTVLDSITSSTGAERRRRREAIGVPAESFVVGKVANFTPKKNHANLIRALSEGNAAKAQLVLIGMGPAQDDVERLVADLGMQERVTFLGTRDDVFDLLPLFDLFTLSSDFEGFPISLVEAMATGLPCVATTVGGIPEVLDDGVNGLLVPPGDSTALRMAIERIMSDDQLGAALGEKARSTAETLDLRHAVGRMEAIYQRVASGRAAVRSSA